MSVIKNISKLVVPAYNKGPKDVIDYINNQACAPVSADVGLIEYPGEFGSYEGSATVAVGLIPAIGGAELGQTINATDLTVYVDGSGLASHPLAYWPATGYANIGSEVFFYSSIVAGNDNLPIINPLYYDHFIIASTADRGVKGTTAASHTAGAAAVITEILFGSTTKIEYNKDQGVFNVWTRTTEVWDSTGYYGDNGWTTVYNTYLIPCPEDVVTFFETAPGVN